MKPGIPGSGDPCSARTILRYRGEHDRSGLRHFLMIFHQVFGADLRYNYRHYSGKDRKPLKVFTEGGFVIFIINGQQESIEKPVTLDALVAAKGLCPEKIVVEHNLSIIAREDWPKITIKDRDMIEVVSFVGGG